MKKKYIFEVQFEYTVEANSYTEAVRLADKQLPDEDGKQLLLLTQWTMALFLIRKP